MRRIRLVLAVSAMIALLLAMVATPAVADNDFRHFRNFDNDSRFIDFDDDVSFLGFPFGLGFFDDIDVDTENVPNNSSLEGDCFRTEFDEVTCFV